MKELKRLNYRGYEVVIGAKYTYDSWHEEYCVTFKMEIYKDDELLKELYETVYEEVGFKFLIWTFKEKKVLKQVAEEELEYLIEYSKRWIDEMAHRKDVTDGLLDSLYDIKLR